MRLHLFEFEDFPWFPAAIRDGGTDYLRYLLQWTRLYEPLIPVIAEALDKTGGSRIIDLCSGGGGSIILTQKGLMRCMNKPISVTLTDKFPNENAFNYIKSQAEKELGFELASVDAADVPKDLKGFRTMFSAVHHFHPQTIKQILRNAVNNNEGIGLFDGGERSILAIMGMILFHPVAMALCTPFFRPFKISRIAFTYFIPLIPLYTIWDGCVSVLRMYKPGELLELAKSIGPNNYTWECGKRRNKFGIPVSYLIGYPTVKEDV